jgi:hypothetical protein
MNIVERDLVVTVGSTNKAGMSQPGWTNFAVKVYVAQIRKKDKTLVWKLYETLDPVPCIGVFPTPQLGRAYAKSIDKPFLLEVRDNDEVDRKPVRKPRGKPVKKKTPGEHELTGRFRRIAGDTEII